MLFCRDKTKQWAKWIQWDEYWFKTTFNQSTDMTPFKALYGKDPPTLFRFEDTVSAVEEVNQQVQARNKVLDELKMHLQKAQDRMKVQANQARRDVSYEVGDFVYLKVRPYKLKDLAKKVN